MIYRKKLDRTWKNKSYKSVCQRFLFRFMNREKDSDIYEISTMIFGSVCSPTMAQGVKNYNHYCNSLFEKKYPGVTKS